MRALVVELAEDVPPRTARAIAEDALADGFALADARDEGRYWNPGHAALVTGRVFRLEHPAGRAARPRRGLRPRTPRAASSPRP